MMKTFLSTQMKEMMKGGPSGLKDQLASGDLFKGYESSLTGEINDAKDIE